MPRLKPISPAASRPLVLDIMAEQDASALAPELAQPLLGLPAGPPVIEHNGAGYPRRLVPQQRLERPRRVRRIDDGPGLIAPEDAKMAEGMPGQGHREVGRVSEQIVAVA